MTNQAMQRKLDRDECLDVLEEGEEISPGVYLLRGFTEGVDYCDAEKEAWIWSIGRNLKTGEIHASTSAQFYQNPEYECLWLR